MRKRFLVALAVVLSGALWAGDNVAQSTYAPVEGDVCFQSLAHCPLVDAIEGATGSPYSHCGIVVRSKEEWRVLEAIGPVKETPLSAWVKQGRGSKYDVYRFKESYRGRIADFVKAARTFTGRPYDAHYRFDNEGIYCSELVYCAFKQAAGEELGTVKALRDLNWQPFVEVIEALEGKGKVPLDRALITPKHLSEAAQLQQVYQGTAKAKKAAQPGATPPGAMPPGVMPEGAMPQGAMPQGAMPAGAAPAGAAPASAPQGPAPARAAPRRR